MVSMVTPKIESVASSENYGRFVAEPLERGFGHTLGNALRRALLSSLPGAAVTAVKIEGVQHEFSTIPHVKEDTTEFLLNVKELRLRPLSEQPGRLILDVAGEGLVCAGDIKPSADVEIVNPELHLATLDSPEAKLKVEFWVEQGKGYVPAGSSNGLPIDVIPVDAIYTPIRRVNYEVEPTRVGHETKYDRLILEVWTDGTISAIEAVNQGAQILVQQFSLFTNIGKEMLEVAEKKAAFDIAISAEKYDIPVEQLDLSARTLNCLRRADIAQVGQLAAQSKEELLAIRNFGVKSFQEVSDKLKALGIGPQVEEEPKPEDEGRADLVETEKIEEETGEPSREQSNETSGSGPEAGQDN